MGERWLGSEFQIFGATDENDLEVAMEVLRKGTHIDKDEELNWIEQILHCSIVPPLKDVFRTISSGIR